MVPSSGPVAPSQADFAPLLEPFICIIVYWERGTFPYTCPVNALPPSHTPAACVSVALSGDIEENKYLHIFRCISQGALFSRENSVVSSFSSFIAWKQSLIHSTLHLRKKSVFSDGLSRKTAEVSANSSWAAALAPGKLYLVVHRNIVSLVH